MKRFSAFILAVFLTVSIFVPAVYADNGSASIDSIHISESGTELTVSCTVSDSISSKNSMLYLFRVTPGNESIKNLTPISQATPQDGKAVFILDHDSTDHSSPLYGYILAVSNGSKGYTALTDARYIDNIGDFAHSNIDYPDITTKKGLEVQYITDAQLLGVGHTVIFARLNDLITEESDDALAYVYGENKYYIDKNELTLLDYRVKTLTDAGIHVYINFILSFDSGAIGSLYYPSAEGGTDTLFAPNVSSPEGVKTFASVMHFLADRYSSVDATYGFCGSYILGYEVNNESENNSADINNLTDYAKMYSTFVRVADLALHTAYSNAKLYVSVSNLFNTTQDTAKPGVFGAKDFLTELVSYIPDINFGIAINPYPSVLTQGAFWNDDKATNDQSTEYVTMKNISVLTSFLNEEKMLYNGVPRSIVISEFGISGVYGEESEKLQAAAFAYAYYIAENEPLIEAFIWHRHVDHISEINLNYGLYTSSELTLDGKDKKLIHEVFSAVGTEGSNAKNLINTVISYLPVTDYESLVSTAPPSRKLITVSAKKEKLSSGLWKKEVLYDFSKSIYDLYPSDNAEYLELLKDGSKSYLRIASVKQSSIEYMGASAKFDDISRLNDSKYLTVRVRIVSSVSSADFSLIINGRSDDMTVSVNCTSEIKTNQWVTLSFPVDSLEISDLEDCTVKLWARSDNSMNEQLYLDIQSISLHSQKDITLIIVFVVIIVMALISAASFYFYIKIVKGRRNNKEPK